MTVGLRYTDCGMSGGYCRHLRTMMSESVPAREKTNSSEPIMQSILLNTTSVSVNSSL